MAQRPARCTLHPNDQLALEGPLSRVKSLKKSLRQSFRRIRRSRVSSRKRRPAGPPGEVRPRPGTSPGTARSSQWQVPTTPPCPACFGHRHGLWATPDPHQPCDLGSVTLLLCASASLSVKGSHCNASGPRPQSVLPGRWWQGLWPVFLEGSLLSNRMPPGRKARARPQAWPTPLQVQEGSSRAERTGLQNMELAPVQRKIEARSAEDSFTGFVRTLYFADTYLRDSEWPAWGGGPSGVRACRRLLAGAPLRGVPPVSKGRLEPTPAPFPPVPGSPSLIALASYPGSTTL